MNIKKLSLKLTLAVILISFMGSPVLAHDDTEEHTHTFGVAISPINSRVNVAAGETHSITFDILNRDPVAKTLSLEEGVFSMGADGNISPAADAELGWLTFPSKIKVKASGIERVNIELSVPADAVNGAYFPAILISESAPNGESGVGASLETNLGFVIGINVLGAYPIESVITSTLSATNPATEPDVDISYTISNTLNAFTKPSARLQVIAPNGARVFEQVINAEEDTFAPGKSLSDVINLNTENSDLSQPGLYRIEMLVLDSQFDSASFSEASFWIIPLPVLILIGIGSLVILLAIMFGGVYLLRNSGKKTSYRSSFK